MTSKNYRKTAMESYNNKICVICGYGNADILDVAHIDHDRKNNKASNLVLLCPTHHREYDGKLITKQMILSRRKFVETMPKATWKEHIGLTKKQLSDNAKKAVQTRKKNEANRKKVK